MAQYVVDFLNSFIGLRKTIVMVALLVVTCIFRLKGYIGPDNFEGLLKATVVSYFGSNSIEHFTTMVRERLTSKGVVQEVNEIDTHTEEG